MGRFVFYFASQAYFDANRGSNGAFPRRGIESYGTLAHEYGIPVTWLTNARGAELGKDLFTRFHEEAGDEVILWGLPFQGADTGKKRDHVLGMTQVEVERYLRREQEGIRAHLPWARVDHVGFFYRTLPAVRAMEALGVQSCYGHCWELIATDGVTDNGVPWGFYYLDTSSSWRRPRQPPAARGVVATEWLQHDLNKCWNYYDASSVFSFDPNDVERAKICDGPQIDYWKAAFREYYRNRAWNAFIPFVFHQEAHEQESTPGGWEVYPPATVANTHAMTEAFLQFLTSGEFPDVEVTTLPAAVAAYRDAFAATEPTYMLFRDVPVTTPEWQRRKRAARALYLEAKADEEAEGGSLELVRDHDKLRFLFRDYGWQGMLYPAPFPEAFVYVDPQVQLFFHEGLPAPVKLWNYTKALPGDPRALYFDEDLFAQPGLEGVGVAVHPITGAGRERARLVVSLASPLACPYGIAAWGDFSGAPWRLAGDAGARAGVEILRVKPIGTHLLFVRVNLVPGEARLEFEQDPAA